MATKPAIVHKTRTQFVVDVIRERILSGEIKAGEPLRQSALADELNVSRIPVREGLLQLEAEGLVKFEAHKGATATELSSKNVQELFELRAMIESDLLARSMPNLTEAHFAEAEELVKQMEYAFENSQDWSDWSELNCRFHECLYKGADRQHTLDLLKSLNNNSDRYVRMHLLLAGGIPRAEHEHAELLNLARSGDIGKAVDLLTKHILNAAADIKKLIEANERAN